MCKNNFDCFCFIQFLMEMKQPSRAVFPNHLRHQPWFRKNLAVPLATICCQIDVQFRNSLRFKTFSGHLNLPRHPGVNFIKVLQAACSRKDPQSLIKTDNLTVFFALSGFILHKFFFFFFFALDV